MSAAAKQKGAAKVTTGTDAKKNPIDWTVSDVHMWVRGIAGGLNEFSGKFFDQSICGRALSMLDKQDLADMGLKGIQIKAMQAHIQSLFPDCVVSSEPKKKLPDAELGSSLPGLPPGGPHPPSPFPPNSH